MSRTIFFIIVIFFSPAFVLASVDQVHLSFAGPTDTSITITWHTSTNDNPNKVEYGTTALGFYATGTQFVSLGSGYFHTVTLTNLQPNTAYYYRVSDDNNVGGWSSVYSFKTAPSSGGNFLFTVFSDHGTSNIDPSLYNTPPTYEGDAPVRIINAAASEKPAFNIICGDLPYASYGSSASAIQTIWDYYMNQIQPLAANASFMPAIGNHDTYDFYPANPLSYLNRFVLPTNNLGNEWWYSFDYGNAHFTMISNNEESTDFNKFSLGTPQYTWLESDLAAAATNSNIKWKFICMHWPAYASSKRTSADPEDVLKIRNNLVPLFEKYGVDMVFQAHDHVYERTFPLKYNPSVDSTNAAGNPTIVSTDQSSYQDPGAPIYMTTGLGGANVDPSAYPWSINPKPDLSATRLDSIDANIGYNRIRVLNDSLTVEFVRISDGNILDSFTLAKGAVTPPPPDTTPPVTFIANIEGDTSSPYVDTIDDSDTQIVVNGESGMACRWYDSDISYTDVSDVLCLTSGTQATCTISPTSNGQSYVKYIACKDLSGNGQSSSQNLDVSWSVSITPPSPSTKSYVVDQNHPQANDDTNPGTEALPWKTLQKAADTLVAGETVYALPGVYKGTITPKNSGTATAPIVYKAMPDGPNPEGAVVIEGGDPAVDLRNKQYISFEGFEIRYTNGVYKGTGVSSSSGYGVDMSNSKGVVLIGNQIHHTYGWDITLDPSQSTDRNLGIGIRTSGASDWLIEKNYIHHTGGKGIAGSTVNRGQTLRNHIHDVGEEDGIQYGYAQDLTIAYNYIHDIWALEPSHTDGIQIWGEDINNKFIGNVLHRFRQHGFMPGGGSTASTNALYEYNIVNIGDSNYAFSVGIKNSTYRHNTVSWGTDWNGGAYLRTNSSGNTLRDNIFQSPTQPAILIESGSPSYTIDNNLFGNSQGILGTRYKISDPLFVDPKTSTSLTLPNVRLRAGSPTIDSASDATDLGALEYPNVYYVEQNHPATTDDLYGYPGVPFKTISKAVSVAQSGETIVVRSGVYREKIVFTKPNIVLKALSGENVSLSGANQITGWIRLGSDSWYAILQNQPTIILRDGQQWAGFTYDSALKRITITGGGDPRLHTFETVVRSSVIDTGGQAGVVIQGIKTINLLPTPTTFTISSVSPLYLFRDEASTLTISGLNFELTEDFKLHLKDQAGATALSIPARPQSTTNFTFSLSPTQINQLSINYYDLELERTTDQKRETYSQKILVTFLGDVSSPTSGIKDGKVDIYDVSRLLSKWGSTLAADLAESDINPGPGGISAGKIDLYDANLMMKNWQP